jgi:predicted nucleic acid-binding protein
VTTPDFADLTLVTLSERLQITEILSLDSDFVVYRRFRPEPFRRVSLPCARNATP